MITVYYFLHNLILVKTTHINEVAPLLLEQYNNLLKNSYIVIQVNSISGSYAVIKECTIINKNTLNITANVYNSILYADTPDVTPLVIVSKNYEDFMSNFKKCFKYLL